MPAGEREIVAHHEAGHAVIARALGVPVECVTIEPYVGHSGIVWHHKSGPAQFTGHRLFCAGDDEAGIASAMPHLPEPREHYEARAKALVLENWDVIEVVADELLIGRGRLYGEMLDAAIRCARP